ncbi:MAG: UDP-N-acetylglucosamine 1-carboxyvinyltransferase [Candidatus Moranbacteria bacterium]|nr:UDP-N-acetylglucosamine 1-carboxyvinyltransferase [Candidatus Moranbacteria bacterium]
MDLDKKFKIIGGKEIGGEIEVNGAKNAALKILAALVLSDEKCVIRNFPFIEDTQRMLELLESMGAELEIDKKSKTVEVNPENITEADLDGEMARRLRASILLVGPLLAKFGKVKMDHPGGCVIGKRPIDMFLEGFKALGAQVETENGQFYLKTSAGGKLSGAEYFFPKITVTGTEAMMMTAVLAEGKTTLKNCAMEPEIPVLADYLNKNGAKIKGAGTPVMEIEGVEAVSAGEFEVIPDRIEAGTFVMLGLIANSEITVKNCNPEHLGAALPILKNAGANLEIGGNYIKTLKHSGMKAVSITTHEYPGFATDMQPPYTLLMTQAEGTSLIHEAIFEGRLFFTDQLATMGANTIMCDPHRVVVSGPSKLYGKRLSSPDLRAGITMVIAGIIAEGETVIDNIYQIDRGYENIDERLRNLGVEIERID